MTEPLPTTEGQFLLYLLEASTARGAASGQYGWLPASGIDRRQRDAAYALGRIRESSIYRLRRLPREAADEREFVSKLIVACQAEDGAAAPPLWPAVALGAIVGMIRHRLFLQRNRAA